jgi:hypothetical protein
LEVVLNTKGGVTKNEKFNGTDEFSKYMLCSYLPGDNIVEFSDLSLIFSNLTSSEFERSKNKSLKLLTCSYSFASIIDSIKQVYKRCKFSRIAGCNFISANQICLIIVFEKKLNRLKKLLLKENPNNVISKVDEKDVKIPGVNSTQGYVDSTQECLLDENDDEIVKETQDISVFERKEKE